MQEGYARDVVRLMNNMRKDAGLEISDRIELAYTAVSDVASALENFTDYVKQETLALKLSAGTLENSLFEQAARVGDQEVTLALRKV